jgi:hypothetical protein
MGRNIARRVRTIRLEFDHPLPDGRTKPVCDNLSAVTALGDQLWFGTDEGTALDCLMAAGLDRYAGHVAFDLKQFLKLPNTNGKRDEIDIEGLSIDDGCLWLVGSHAVTRDKADPAEDGPDKAIRKLEGIDRNPNRWTLARIPLAEQAGSGFVLSKTVPGVGAEASRQVVAQLKATEATNALLKILADDRHLKPFMDIPAKENGFDIEGLAVRGQRIFLGLRGPVLRGWALLLELAVETDGAKLKLRPIASDGRRYRKHFLDLEGCGVRDLCFAGDTSDDLLVLAGPSMALDGVVRVHRWTVPKGEAADTISTATDCPALLDVPHRRGSDRAEGMVMIVGSKEPELLVVYDSPAQNRRHSEGFVDADVFGLPR